MDVFAARRRADGVTADFKHLLRAGAGRLLFGAAENLTGTVLVVKGLPGSALRLMPLDALDGAGCDELVAAQVDAWVSGVAEAVTRDFTYRPSIDLLVSAEAAEQSVEAGRALSARRGVVWVSSEEAGLAYLGTEEGGPGRARRGPGHPRQLGDRLEAGRRALPHNAGAARGGAPDARPGGLQRSGPERR